DMVFLLPAGRPLPSQRRGAKQAHRSARRLRARRFLRRGRVGRSALRGLRDSPRAARLGMSDIPYEERVEECRAMLEHFQLAPEHDRKRFFRGTIAEVGVRLQLTREDFLPIAQSWNERQDAPFAAEELALLVEETWSAYEQGEWAKRK